MGLRPQLHEGLEQLSLQLKIQLGGEANGPEHPQTVLSEPQLRLPHTADAAPLKIATASKGVKKLSVRSHGHGVDGKVTAGQVCLQGGDKGDGIWSATVPITVLLAEGGHFHGPALQYHRHRAVGQTGGHSVGKEGLDLAGQGRGAYVPVLGRAGEKQVPDTSPHRVGLEPGGVQSLAATGHKKGKGGE